MAKLIAFLLPAINDDIRQGGQHGHEPTREEKNLIVSHMDCHDVPTGMGKKGGKDYTKGLIRIIHVIGPHLDMLSNTEANVATGI